MKIEYSKQFRKQFRTLPVKDQDRFWERLEWFKADRFDPRLNNHGLTGKLKSFRSINITGDLRAIYQLIDDELYLYEMIGSHAQLYGK